MRSWISRKAPIRKTSLAIAAILFLLLGLGFTTVIANAASARPPSAPTHVTAVPGDRSAEVSWTPPASTDGLAIAGYVITASPGGASVTTTNVTSYQVGQLVNGRRYTFTVTAVTSA